MIDHQNIVVLITLAVAATFLFIWKRRDAVAAGQDGQPD